MSTPGTPAPAATVGAEAGNTAVPQNSELSGELELANAESGGSEEGEEAEEGSDPKVEAAQEKKQEEIKKSLKRKIALKVNGKQQEVEFDPENDEEIARYLQKAYAADEKFQQASKVQKQMESFIDALRNDPLAILSHPDLGLDVKQLAERVINQEIEEMQKSPEQREREKMQKEIEEYKRQLEEKETLARQAEMQRLEDQYFTELDRDITAALESTKDLPKSPYVVKRIADALIDANQLGYHDVKVEDIVPLVKKQILNELQQMFGGMPEELIESMLGENLKRVKQKKLAKIKSTQNAANVKQTADAQANKDKNKEPQKKISMKDFFKNV